MKIVQRQEGKTVKVFGPVAQKFRARGLETLDRDRLKAAPLQLSLARLERAAFLCSEAEELARRGV